MNSPSVVPRALYVHVPFCRAFCAYCDFARELYAPDRVVLYLAALDRELHQRVGRLTAAARVARFAPATVYIGGGTPTSLSADELGQLLEVLARHVDGFQAAEFTVEANPGTLDGRPGASKLDVLRRRGVNRLSLGVQSFQPRLLKLLGRIHTPEQAPQAVAAARAAGFANLSLDLIHGLPGQTRAELVRDLEEAVALAPEHVSAYGLSYEEGTPLKRAVARGQVAPWPPEEEAAHYELVVARLEACGFAQYEISNYARPGFEARHNLVYWRNEAYLGVGPAAASYLGGERTVNARMLDEYLTAVRERGEAVATREALSPEARAREALILELRLRAGVEPKAFQARWGLDLEASFGAALTRFQGQGMMERTAAERWRITRAGLPVADTILSEFV
jgi:oxygen-independent coproporphyrinogen-3 oxidase